MGEFLITCGFRRHIWIVIVIALILEYVSATQTTPKTIDVSDDNDIDVQAVPTQDQPSCDCRELHTKLGKLQKSMERRLSKMEANIIKAVHEPCPRDYDLVAGICFKVMFGPKLSWNAADRSCRSLTHNRTRLLEVENGWKFQAIAKKIGEFYPNSEFWLGIRRYGSRWRWVQGDFLSYTDQWDSDEPDGSGMCASIYCMDTDCKKSMWDESCDFEYHYICEMLLV